MAKGCYNCRYGTIDIPLWCSGCHDKSEWEPAEGVEEKEESDGSSIS